MRDKDLLCPKSTAKIIQLLLFFFWAICVCTWTVPRHARTSCSLIGQKSHTVRWGVYLGKTNMEHQLLCLFWLMYQCWVNEQNIHKGRWYSHPNLQQVSPWRSDCLEGACKTKWVYSTVCIFIKDMAKASPHREVTGLLRKTDDAIMVLSLSLSDKPLDRQS